MGDSGRKTFACNAYTTSSCSTVYDGIMEFNQSSNLIAQLVFIWSDDKHVETDKSESAMVDSNPRYWFMQIRE